MHKMFSTMLGYPLNNHTNNESMKMAEIARKQIETYLLQNYLDDISVIDDANQSGSVLMYSKYLLSMLGKNLNVFIAKNINNCFNRYQGYQLHCNYGIRTIQQTDVDELNDINCHNIYPLNNINSIHYLFPLNLKTSTSIKDGNMIIHINKKYGDYNLNISMPIFTFERFVSNFIVWYELFDKGHQETAKTLFSLIFKWLIKLDGSSDKLYLSISNGLKYVILLTFIHITKLTTISSQELILFGTFIPYCDLDHKSKAAVHAIQAIVFIEYGYDESYFIQADKYAKLACDLDPTNPYWFYFHSLVLTAYRRFLHTSMSCPTKYEMKAIQQAIVLSNDQNIFIKYHEIVLFKDTVLDNFKKIILPNVKLVWSYQKTVEMIKILVSIEPRDPFILVNCARVLIEFPTKVCDIYFEKHLLIKGIQMAPNDFTVLKAVIKAILHRQTFISNHSTLFTILEDNLPRISTQANIGEDLKVAVQKYNMGIDPIPFLLSLLNNYDDYTQCIIFSQICSYTILINNNIILGVEYLMKIVGAELRGIPTRTLILSHHSIFIDNFKEINLVKLISNKINLALENNHIQNREYYYDLLFKIMLIYETDENIGGDTSLSDSTNESKNIIFERGFNNNDVQKDIDCVSTIKKNSKKCGMCRII